MLLTALLLSGVPASAHAFSFGLHVREPGGVLPLHASIAAQTGAEAIPVRFAWDEVEPQPGRFSFSRQAAFIAAARAQGFHIVGVLEYPRELPLPVAPAARTGWPSGHPDDWSFFVAHVVSHFRDDVDAWVIDAGRFGDQSGAEMDLFQAAQAESHAAFLRLTAGTVRRNEPRKSVLAVAPGTDIAWLRVFSHYGGLAAIDGLAVNVNRWPTGPSGLGIVLTQLQDAIRELGESPILWVWEFGYPNHDGLSPAAPGLRGVTVEQQAIYAVQSHVRLLSAGASAVFYRELLDQGPEPTDPGSNFGMYTWELEAKPLFHAYGTMTQMMRGLRYARPGDVIRRPILPTNEPPEENVPSGDGVPDSDNIVPSDDDVSGDGRSPRAVASVTEGMAPKGVTPVDVGMSPREVARSDDGVSARGDTLSSLERLSRTEVASADAGMSPRGAAAPSVGADSDNENETMYDPLPAPSYHFVFNYELLQSQLASDSDMVAARVFTGERATVIVLWTEPPVAGSRTCRDGCGQTSILPWLDGVPIRAYDMYGEEIGNQNEWQLGSAPIYIELPMEMVP